MGCRVITVPTTNAMRVTMSVYNSTCSILNSVLETRKQMMDTNVAGMVNTATWMRPK